MFNARDLLTSLALGVHSVLADPAHTSELTYQEMPAEVQNPLLM
jgi:hypothetical protein